MGVAMRASLGRIAGVTIGLIAVCVYLLVTEPSFLTWANWQNIIRGQSVVAVLALGMTFVVLTGGIDLAVASSTAVAAVVLGIVVGTGVGWPIVILVVLAAGLGLGLANGLLIGVAKIPFFVVTLGTLAIYQSVALLLSKTGETKSLVGVGSFGSIGDFVNGTVGPIPTVLIVVAVLYLIGGFVLVFTRFGRAVYAVGSNPEAARLGGINVRAVIIAAYAIMGVLAGTAAVLQVGRLSAAAPTADPNLMLNVVAAVLIGGVAFTGGDGNLLGALVGVVFLGVIQNGLTLSDISTFWQGTISGLILIVAVAIGVLREHAWVVRGRFNQRSKRPPDEGVGDDGSERPALGSASRP